MNIEIRPLYLGIGVGMIVGAWLGWWVVLGYVAFGTLYAVLQHLRQPSLRRKMQENSLTARLRPTRTEAAIQARETQRAEREQVDRW